MKAIYILEFALLMAIPLASQCQQAPTSKSLKRTVEPDCPSGRGCKTFKQMWNGGDVVATSATWACFTQLRGDYDADFDEVLLLRDGASVFELRRFTDGIERIASKAQAEYVRDGIAHWKPDDSSVALEVTKSRDTLEADLRYLTVEDKKVHFHFNMRLSSGRFESVWQSETKAVFSSTKNESNYSGQCIIVPKK